jgi:hypothetical protein
MRILNPSSLQALLLIDALAPCMLKEILQKRHLSWLNDDLRPHHITFITVHKLPLDDFIDKELAVLPARL